MHPLWLGILLGSGVTAAAAVVLAAFLGRRMLRRQRRLERENLEAQRLAELGMLTGGLAHEIKNPLSTLQLNLQLLREDLESCVARSAAPAGATPAADAHAMLLQQHAVLSRMLRRLGSLGNETHRLREILDDFLRYAGRFELEPRPVNLAELTDELVDFLSPQAQLARINIHVECDDADPTASADPKLLKQALLNLMLNALQHTPAGGRILLRIEPARLEEPGRRGGGDAIAIHVLDTGPGIPPEEQSRVFDPYFSRRKGGSGLGLPTTRRIAHAHGGTIALQSEPGSGSRFTLTIPRRRPGEGRGPRVGAGLEASAER